MIPAILRREHLAVFLILIVALVLRIADIFWHPFGPDEGWTMELATGSWADLVRKTAEDTHPPLHYSMVKAWFAIVGEGLYRAKLLSVFFDVAMLWTLWLLARDWFGSRAAMLALLSATLSPYMIYWSHVARNHLFQPLFITAILLLSGRFLRDGGKASWLLLALCWALAIQMNYMAFPVGLVWGVVYILMAGWASWRRRLTLALAPLPGLLLFLPWLGIMRQHSQGSPMTVSFFQEFVTPISLYHHAIFGAMTHLQPSKDGLWFLFTLLVFTAVFVAAGKRIGRRWDIWVLLLALPGLPILIAVLADYTLAERHLRFALPVFFACWGAGLVGLWEMVKCRLQRCSQGGESVGQENNS